MATVQEALLIAFDLHQEGRLAEADAIYGQILDAVPGHPMTLHLRGLLLGQSGRLEEACTLIRQAISGDETQPDFHGNLANLLETLGRHDEAAHHLARAAALDPDRIGLLNNFALRRLKDGRADAAAQALRMAVDLQPLCVDPRVNLAHALAEQGQCAAAVDQNRIVVCLVPDDSESVRTLGERFYAQSRAEEAGRTLTRALRLDPLHPTAWNLVCCLHKDAVRLHETRRTNERGLSLDPASVELWNNRSNILKGLDDSDGALTALCRAGALRPDSPEVLNNMADALLYAGRPGDALASAQGALAFAPDLADAKLIRALALLSMGRFKEGWAAWEDRWAAHPWCLSAGRFPQPTWAGEPLGEGRLLIWSEQGIGDEIQFASIVPLLTQAGVRCVLECDTRLVTLLARSLPGVEVVARTTPPDARLFAPDIAAQIPAGSLPRLLLNEAEDFRRLRPYLIPDSTRVAALRAKKAGDGLVIGIAWHTTNPKSGRNRNISLAELARSLHRPGVRLVVLQYGDWSREVAELVEEGIDIGVPPDLDAWNDMEGLAAQIAGTDLVVSISNVTVHMACSLGHPVWVLLAHAPDWRWMRDRPDSLWYPTATLFRQPAPKDWSTPLQAVRERLETWRPPLRRGHVLPTL